MRCVDVLQERLLGEDGNPRKTKDNEDPFRMGLVLEWVYGTIVSTAEKARDSAKKPLGRLCSPMRFCGGMCLRACCLSCGEPASPMLALARRGRERMGLDDCQEEKMRGPSLAAQAGASPLLRRPMTRCALRCKSRPAGSSARTWPRSCCTRC